MMKRSGVRKKLGVLLVLWLACAEPTIPRIEAEGAAVCTRVAPASDSAVAAHAQLWTIEPTTVLSMEQQTWLSRLRDEPTTAEVHVARLSPVADSLLFLGSAVVLPMAPGEAVVAVGDNVERRGPTDVSWTGPIAGEFGRATLVLSGRGITASMQSVRTDDADRLVIASYRATPIGGGLEAVVCIDASKLPPDD